jgi:23S rRNA (cytosine1962-C5)-methyltransferase
MDKKSTSASKKSKAAAGLPAEPIRVLSLFGYTGASALVAASNGAVVTQVDASKPALSWAKHNQQLSGLSSTPIRFLLDDALKFLKRECRRNSRYDALILDPPSFGRGPKGEVWKAEKSLPILLEHCAQVLSEQPLFILLNMYALEASALMLGNLLSEMIGERGSIEIGELALQPNFGKHPLPLAIFARWSIAV